MVPNLFGSFGYFVRLAIILILSGILGIKNTPLPERSRNDIIWLRSKIYLPEQSGKKIMSKVIPAPIGVAFFVYILINVKCGSIGNSV